MSIPGLSDTQLVILTAAAGRDDGGVLPLPASLRLRGGARNKVLKSLLKRRLIEEDSVAVGADHWRATAEDIGEISNRAAVMVAVLEAGLPHGQLTLIQEIARRVTVKNDALVVEVRNKSLLERLGAATEAAEGHSSADRGARIVLPIAFRRRGVQMKLVLDDHANGRAEGNVDPALVRLVSQALDWFERIAGRTAQGPGDIVAQDCVPRTQVSRALPLAFLAPDIVRAIHDGRQPPELTATALLQLAPTLPSLWSAQPEHLGFGAAWPVPTTVSRPQV